MTPLERFNAWVAGGEAPGMTYKRAVELARGLGDSQDKIDRSVKQIGYWLAKNETEKKANKKLWGKFLLNWLGIQTGWQPGRLEPSNFD